MFGTESATAKTVTGETTENAAVAEVPTDDTLQKGGVEVLIEALLPLPPS